MNLSGLPRMPWFPRDFRSSTMLWPLIARAVYRELLDLSWDVGGLPADPDELCLIVRATSEEWRKAWSYVEPKFPLSEDGLRRNSRLEMHRADSQERQTKAHNKASHAATVGWEKRRSVSASGDSSSSSSGNASSTLQASAQAMPSSARSKTPDSGVSFGDSRPLARTSRPRPAYESQEFHQQVIEAYHELLPGRPKVKAWDGSRPKHLNARIAERLKANKTGLRADTLAYWHAFFGKVSENDWRMGRDKWKGVNIDWLLEKRNFIKVIEEGTGDNTGPAPRTSSNGAATYGR